MLANRAVRYLAVAIGTVLAFGCTDNGTAPTASLRPPATTIAFARFSSGKSVKAVHWQGGSADGASVSGTIGPNGGTLSIPETDFTIVFPRGAVTRATLITIVAGSDGYVGYEMLPHGLTFAVPVIAVQGLSRAAASDGVFCAYLAPGNEIDGKGNANAAEIETSTTNFIFQGARARAIAQVWTLNHFSRYILASGVTSDDSDNQPPSAN